MHYQLGICIPTYKNLNLLRIFAYTWQINQIVIRCHMVFYIIYCFFWSYKSCSHQSEYGKEKVTIMPSWYTDSLLVLDDTGSSETTGTPGGDESDLSTVRFVTVDGWGHTDVLMVTTSVGMLYWVHAYTSHLRPRVTLYLVLVVGASGLE